MRTFYFIVFLVMAHTGFYFNSKASTSHQIFENAVSLYKKKNYAEALIVFKKLQSEQGENYRLFFNIGNCYYKLDSIGRAIQFYEKTLKLNPGNEEAANNLKFARQKTTDKIEPLPELILTTAWNRFLTKWSEDFWAWISVLFLFLSGSAFLLFKFSTIKNYRKISFFSLIAFLLLTVLTWAFASAAQNYRLSASKGVILSSSETVKSEPDESGRNLFVLHEGTLFHILEKDGSWVLLKLDNGKSGWLKISSIGEI